MKTAAIAFKLLTDRDKWVFSALAAARVLITFLDLAGLALVGITVTVLTGGGISASSLTGRALQLFRDSGFENTYAVVGTLAVFFFFFKGLTSLWLNNVLSNFLVKVESQRAEAIFQGILSNGLGTLDTWTSKQLLHAVSSSASTGFAQSLIVSSVVIGEAALLFAVSIFLAYQNILLFAFLALFFGVFGVVLSKYIGSRSSSHAGSINSSYFSLSTVFSDAIGNLRQIVALGLSKNFIQEFARFRATHAKANARLLLIGYLPRYVTEMLLMLGLGALLLQRSLDGGVHVPAATLGVFIAGAFRMIASILPLQGSFANLRVIDVDAQDALNVYGKLARQKVEPVPSKENLVHREIAPLIKVSSLTYRHESDPVPVIRNLSFEVKPGQRVALIGKSGSGKSTLADLLLGLRKSNEGGIFFDGIPVQEYLRESSSAVAYVPQEAKLISGSLKQNITLDYGSKDFDYEFATQLLESVGLKGWFDSLPNAFEELLGDGARELSGGQLQRIGIVRALYRKPLLLILDESTSALDQSSEQAVENVIQNLAPQVTVIVISHRPEALYLADLIVDLSK